MATTTAAATATRATAITTLVAVAVVLLALPTDTTAQSPTPAPGPMAFSPGPSAFAPGPALDCLSTLVNMSDCLSFVESGSNLTMPDKPCCPEFAGLVESSPFCLCHLLANPDQIGIPIDLKKALSLPTVCKVDTPSTTLCAVIGVPVSLPPGIAPASGPASGPTAGEPAGSALSPEGLPSSPASGNGNNNGNAGTNIEASHLCFLAGLATLISISFF